MSSRRLWILLQHLPEDSAFKTALRDGDWTLKELLLTAVFNQVHAMRGDGYGEGFAFQPILSPGMQREKDAKQEIVRQTHDDVLAQLRGEGEQVV